MAHDNLQTTHRKAVLSPMRPGLGKGVMPRRAAGSKLSLPSYVPTTEFWNLCFRWRESDWSSGILVYLSKTPRQEDRCLVAWCPYAAIYLTSTGLCCTQGSSLSDVQTAWLVVCQPMHSIDCRGNQPSPSFCTGSHRDSNGLRKSGKIFSLLCRIYMGRDNSINS